jgi:uncharacterized membrane protein YbhN (UPF0104 family)
VIGACVVLLMKLPGIEDVRARFNSAEPWWIAVAAACSLISMFGFVRALWAAFDRLVPWRRALILGFAEQGANVLLPAGGAGGPALGALVMKRAGVPGELAAQRHAVLFLATSAVSFVALAVAGITVTIGLLRGDAPLVGSLLPAVVATIVIVLCVVAARADAPREPQGSGLIHTIWRVWMFVHDGLRTTLFVLRRGDRLLIAGAVTYYAFDVAALGAAFQAFGGGAPPVGEFVLAYTIGHAGALLPTPGGVGGTEGGLIGMMVVYGAPADVATAAVLAYRVFQLGLPAVLGALSLLRIRALLSDESRRDRVAAAFEAAREAGRW